MSTVKAESITYRAGVRPLLACSLAMVTSLICPFSLLANEEGHEEHHTKEVHHKHALGLFVGITQVEGESLETLGIEYSYRINHRWTVGGVIERADRERDSTLGIAFVHYWPWRGLFLGGAWGARTLLPKERTPPGPHLVMNGNLEVPG